MNKKLMIGAVMLTLAGVFGLAALEDGQLWTGTRVGANAAITNGVEGAIAIGDGATGSCAFVSASGACQIGHGENATANTLKYQSKYVLLCVTNNQVMASQIDPNVVTNVLSAGMVLPAVSGYAVTNINAANIKAGTVMTAVNIAAATNYPVESLVGTALPAVSGAALTSLNAANVTGTYGAGNGAAITNLGAANLLGNIADARMTNARPFAVIAAGSCTNGQVVTYPKGVATSVGAVILQPIGAFGTTNFYPSAVTITNFTANGAVGATIYYTVTGAY